MTKETPEHLSDFIKYVDDQHQITELVNKLNKPEITSLAALVLKVPSIDTAKLPTQTLQNIVNRCRNLEPKSTRINYPEYKKRLLLIKILITRSFEYLRDEKQIEVGNLSEILERSFLTPKTAAEENDLQKYKESLDGVNLRIFLFARYLKSFATEAEFAQLMTSFCCYVNLLASSDFEKVRVCLQEFPPAEEYLACAGGSQARITELITDLIQTVKSRPIYFATTMAIDAVSNFLKEKVGEGNHVHIPSFLKYCFGFIPADKITDEFYNLPRFEIDPNSLLQAFESFFVEFKKYLKSDCLDEDSRLLRVVMRYPKQPTAVVDQFSKITEELQYFQIPIADVFTEDFEWNLPALQDEIEEIREKRAALVASVLSQDNALTKNHSESEISDSSSSAVNQVETLSPRLFLETKPQELVKDLLEGNIEQKTDAIIKLWMLGTLEYDKNSYYLFVRTIYKLGEKYYKKQKKIGELVGLDADNHFENAKIFLKSIADQIPEHQKSKIQHLVFGDEKAFFGIDDPKFKSWATLAFYEESISSSLPSFAIDITPDNADQFIIKAVEAGLSEAFRKILDQYRQLAESKMFLIDKDEICSLIHLVAQCGTPEMVDLILKINPDFVNSRTVGNAMTPLMIACRDNPQIIDHLPNCNFADVDGYGFTALQYAVVEGKADAVSKIFEAGAGVEVILQETSAEGKNQNALVCAIILSKKNPEVLAIIIEQIKKQVINKQDLFRHLAIALSSGFYEAAEELLKCDLDVNYHGIISGRPVDSLLIWLIRQRPKDIAGAVKFLLEKGADVNYKHFGWYLPLSFTQNPEVIALLVANGADLSSDPHGKNSLKYLLTLKPDKSILKLVLENLKNSNDAEGLSAVMQYSMSKTQDDPFFQEILAISLNEILGINPQNLPQILGEILSKAILNKVDNEFIIKHLLRDDVDYSFMDSTEATPIQNAIYLNNPTVFMAILPKVERFDFEISYVSPQMGVINLIKDLFTAVSKNDILKTRELLTKVEDVSVINVGNKDGKNILDIATEQGQRAIAGSIKERIEIIERKTKTQPFSAERLSLVHTKNNSGRS